MIKLTTLAILTVFLFGCEQTMQANGIVPKAPIDKQTIAEIEDVRFFFGHQSVGENIMTGLEQINSNVGGNLDIKQAEPKGNSKMSHLYIGENTKPYTKIQHFEQIVEKNAGSLDVAMYKFCYVDITAETDVKALFESYSSSIDSLQKKYPGIKFIKSTAPIRVVNTSLKAKLKRLLGKSVWGDLDAVKRDEYNLYIREKYKNDSNFFDIAGYQSTLNDESYKVQVNDGMVESLNPIISSDGRHLNNEGSVYIASKLIKHLSK